MAAGSIIIDLLLRTGSFETDTKRAEAQLKKLERQVVSAGALIGTAIVAGVGLAAAAFDQLIKSAANFKDLEETTGASAEGLASLAIAAATAGVPIEEVAGSLQKLTKNLTGVDDESKAAGAAIKALGLNVEAFKQLDPVGQFDALTKAFGGFADGAGKTAVAMALFGKAGAEQLKVFKALQEQGGRQTILTQQQIELADEYADKQAKATAQLKLYAQAAASQALPALNSLTLGLRDLIGEIAGVGAASAGLAANNAIRDFAEDAAVAIAFVIDDIRKSIAQIKSFAATTKLEFQQIKTFLKFRFATDQDFEDLSRLKKEANDAADAVVQLGKARSFASRLAFSFTPEGKINQAIQSDPRELARRLRPVAPAGAPQLNFEGAAKKVAGGKAAKDQIDDITKSIQALEKELALFGQDEEFKKAFELEGLGATNDQLAAYRANLAQLKGLKSEADIIKTLDALKKERDELEMTSDEIKLHELALSGATQAQIEFARQLQGDIGAKKLRDDLKSINAELLELQGRGAEAAKIRFDQQFGDVRKRAVASGDTGAVKVIDQLESAKRAQFEFTQESERAETILRSLATQEDRISLSRQVGATTELGAIRQLGDARQAAIRQLEQVVAAEEAIASGPNGNDKLRAQAEAARLELEKLVAVADPLADKFNAIFEDAFADSFTGFLNGTKTAKQAFLDFSNSIFNEINRIIAKDFAKSLFGNGGVFGNVGKGLGDILSPKSKDGAISNIFGPGPETGAGESGGVPNNIFKDLGITASAQTSAVRTSTVAITELSTAQKTATSTIVSSTEATTFAFGSLTEAANAAAFALSSIQTSGGQSSGGGLFGDLGSIFTSEPLPGGDFTLGNGGLGSDIGNAGFDTGGFFGQSAPSGEQSIAKMFTELGGAQTETKQSTQKLGESTTTAADSILKMATAASKGGGALDLLPELIRGLFSGGASSPGMSILTGIGSLFGGFFADGGAPPLNKVSVVGERGPELFVPRTAGMIVPLDKPQSKSDRNGTNVTNNFTIQGPVDRRTEEQIAAAAFRGASRANLRRTA